MVKRWDKMDIVFIDTGNFYRSGIVSNVQEIFGDFTVKFDNGQSLAFDKDGYGLITENVKAIKHKKNKECGLDV
ncbi:MAG: hypothetical protein ACRC0Y_09020 [Fusobacteriaceae bacterium]